MNPPAGAQGSRRLVVGVTGASGMLYARELFAYLAGRPDLEVHAVASEAGEQVLRHELDLSLRDLAGRRAVLYRVEDIGAAEASSADVSEAPAGTEAGDVAPAGTSWP